MESKKKNPVLMLAVAMLILVAGSFLTLLEVGMSARKSKELHYDFNFRGAALAAATYASDVERGAGIAKAKAADIFDDYFGGSSAASSGGTSGERTAGADQTASGESASGDEVQGEYTPDGDAFEKYYEKHYGKNSEGSSPSLGWNDGGGFTPGGSGGGESATSQSYSADADGRPSSKKREAASPEQPAADKAAAGQDAPQASALAPRGSGSPASKMTASLPGGAPGSLPQLQPGQPPASGGGFGPAAKNGGLSGFQNKTGAAQLDSALEKASTGAKNDYSANMSGGAAAAAAKGAAAGGGVPAASKPADASGDGKSAGGAGGSGGSGGDKASADKDAKSVSKSSGRTLWDSDDDDSSPAPAAKAAVQKSAPGDQDLVKTVVTERQSGEEVSYLTPEDYDAAPDEPQLLAGAVALKPETRTLDKEAAAEPDPKEFKKLSPERKTELRKEMHSFMKRVENKYGKMRAIYYTPCSTTPEVCKANGLTQSYLTMTTSEGAELMLGVKYVKDRWSRYTVDFKRPGGQGGSAGSLEEELNTGNEEDEE